MFAVTYAWPKKKKKKKVSFDATTLRYKGVVAVGLRVLLFND